MSSHSSANHTNHHHAQRQRNETHSTRNDIRMVGKSLKYKKRNTCRYNVVHLLRYLKTMENERKNNKKVIFQQPDLSLISRQIKAFHLRQHIQKNATARRTTKLFPFFFEAKKKKKKEGSTNSPHMKKVNSITYSVELGLYC